MRQQVRSWLWLLVLVLAQFCACVISQSCAPTSPSIPTPHRLFTLQEHTREVLLGRTPIQLTWWTRPNTTSTLGGHASDGNQLPTVPSTLSLSMLNVHQNENTSVNAAKTLMMFRPEIQKVMHLVHGGTRLVSFQMDESSASSASSASASSASSSSSSAPPPSLRSPASFASVLYTFDPNRMFTPIGAEASLRQYGPFSDAALQAVLQFSRQVLDTYEYDALNTVITLHNNGPTYSACDYLPGGVYQNDAAAVFIGDTFSPRDFMYVTEPSIYQSIKDYDISVILQNNTAVTDDGSLSVLAGRDGKRYVNTEAAAADGSAKDPSTGDRLQHQIAMLNALVDILLVEATS